MLSGIASAVPATLVLFFVQDRLQATPAQEPLFLGSYFICAALAIPLWPKAVARWGLARTWLAGMVLSIAVFASVATLGAGDIAAFVVVCALPGAALGADLALPGALLAGVIAAQGDSGRCEGAYFGWWNFAPKLNLALAAGLALPLLGALGYSPGTRDVDALRTLALALCRAALRAQAASGSGAGLLFCARQSARAGCPSNTLQGFPMPQKRSATFSFVLATALAAAAAALVVLLSGCAAPKTLEYAQETPVLDLSRYFNGRLQAHGMFQDRFGKVVKRFTVAVNGRWTGNQGVLDEQFSYPDGSTESRVWHLAQHPDGRVTVTGTAADVVGKAVGQRAGNSFHWRYTLRQPRGGSIPEVQMDDWMVIVDERVVLGRTRMSKLGVRLGDVTLSLHKP